MTARCAGCGRIRRGMPHDHLTLLGIPSRVPEKSKTLFLFAPPLSHALSFFPVHLTTMNAARAGRSVVAGLAARRAGELPSTSVFCPLPRRQEAPTAKPQKKQQSSPEIFRTKNQVIYTSSASAILYSRRTANRIGSTNSRKSKITLPHAVTRRKRPKGMKACG